LEAVSSSSKTLQDVVLIEEFLNVAPTETAATTPWTDTTSCCHWESCRVHRTIHGKRTTRLPSNTVSTNRMILPAVS